MSNPTLGTMRRAARRVGPWTMIVALGIGAASIVSSPGTAADRTATGPGLTVGPDEGPASRFPSTIDVDGVPGRVVSARVTLTDLVHSWTSDLNIGLQSPDGRTMVLMAGCRGDDDSSDAVDGTLTFADGGELLADDTQGSDLGTGTYAPAQCGEPFFGDGGPHCPCGSALAPLAGADPNGIWSLYVYDDYDQDGGSLSSWTLELTTNAAPVAGNGTFRRPENTAVRGTLAPLTSDPDNDDLDFALVTPPDHGTAFVSSAGTFVYTPDRGYVGVDKFTYRVDDDHAIDQGVVTIRITEVPLPHATCAGRTATIVGTAGPDRLTGTPGADVIVSRGGRDRIAGRGGNDTICAGAGADIVQGGPGADVINAGAARDTLLGGIGDDTLTGNLGRDILAGGSGNDALRGSGDSDTLLGRSGDDHLRGGLGTDTCDGGAGTDRAPSCERLLGVP
jgi:Ca2+-binding RTX toxin-like protein